MRRRAWCRWWRTARCCPGCTTFSRCAAFPPSSASSKLTIGLLIAGRIFSPTLSAIGGFLSAGLFVTTLSIMISTPGVIEPSLGFPAISVAPGQFLLKDIGLLAASVFILGHSLSAMALKRAARSGR